MKKWVAISVVAYGILLSTLVYMWGVKYAFMLFDYKDKNPFDFAGFLSNISTVGVFVWAIWTFREQQADKKKDDNLKRVKDISDRLISFVGFSGFSLNQNSAKILIAFLSVMRKEESKNMQSDEIKNEVALVLTVVSQAVGGYLLFGMIGKRFRLRSTKCERSNQWAKKIPAGLRGLCGAVRFNSTP